MKAVIFGNGLNIKFGGKDYLNYKILRRGFNLLQQERRSHEVVPPVILQFSHVMCKEVPKIIEGMYDSTTDDLEDELKRFKKKYESQRISDFGSIGMEDYFFLLHIIFQYNRAQYKGTDEEEIFSLQIEKEATECFKDLCLMGIYNNNKINMLYKKYPPEFIKFVNQFDHVFTTNYDLNLDNIYSGKVQHIHGQFDVLDQLYDPKSFRNSLGDDQFNKNHLVNPEKYKYLHSTALMCYSGKQKIEQSLAKKNLNLITIGDIEKVPDSMVNPIAKQLAIEAKKKQLEDTSLQFQYLKALDNYNNFTGELTIIGLSSNNDNHIFRKNSDIAYTYYYFSDEDLAIAKDVLPNSAVFEPVKNLWDRVHK